MLSSHWEAVLAFCGTLGAAALAWLGSRGSSSAALQASLNDALRLFMEESQRDRGRLNVHVSEQAHELDLLRDQLGDAKRDNLELSGDIANLRQAQESTLRLQEKQGKSPIPPSSALRREPDEGGTDT